MKKRMIVIITLFALTGLVGMVQAAGHEDAATSAVLIKNVNVFDGKSDELIPRQDVLVKGNLIEAVGQHVAAPQGATTIDGNGRTLTPGFIDAHTHLQWNMGVTEHMFKPLDYQAALSLVEAESTLMRGFTTIRDVAGSIFGVKSAIDEGYFVGPRIYSGGAALSMTTGHGDFRSPSTMPRMMGGAGVTDVEYAGLVIFADGVPEVLTASRMQFRKGAHFLKVFTGGAVSGLYDPLDIAEYSLEELKAAVGEAERWNTYVAVHTYTDAATRMAIEAGAKTLEHANLITEKTVKLAAKKGVYISAQTALFMSPPPESFTLAQRDRQQQAKKGLDNLMTSCKKHKANVLFGTDMVGSMELKKLQVTEFTNRTQWFTNAEILRQATSVNAEVLALSGPRNPYPGKLGVIEKGALADILLVNGNPLEDISILTKPDENLALIMKDGKIYKNTIE
ncbi:metal-dependent hydrolase family protein [Desulfoluna spongiiphila]|uniref:metal-dependent hydrolase family protein n=1 Tax=Desulfoluna spongiiphila TaxID=419481 RepID=UPI0012548E2F|nr:amidohydrolase family protein [Desulfoluna spongiiphila]VVS91653.1 metal-dependent hydrolase [Desulfoluna spongiiphila]